MTVGPMLDVSEKMLQRSKYNISTWLKLAPGSEPSESSEFIISMAYTVEGETKYENLYGPKVVTASDGWVNLNFDYTMAYDADEVSLYIESEGDTASFYMDDFCVTYIPPTSIQTDIPSPKGTPKIDGYSELLWYSTAPILVQGDNGYVGSFKTRWDENNLYVLAKVTDVNPTEKAGSIDVFVNDTKSTFVRGITNNNSNTTETDNGYLLEAKIPLSSAVALKDKLPFDIRFVDGSGIQISWNDKLNNQDKSKEKLGTLILSEEVGATEAIKGTPIIDGTMDEIWNSTNEISVNKYINTTTGAIATARTMWDENKLYVFVVVTDSSLHKESKDAYQQDSIEIFVDQKNDRTEFYGDDDGQYRINFNNEQSFGSNPGGSSLTSAAIVTDTGYIVEAAIDLDKINATEGTVLGFDIQVNNSDNSAGIRDGVAIWNDISGNSGSSLANIGVVKLVSDLVEITSFATIPNVNAGTAGRATYANAAAVIATLPTSITANTSGGTVSVPVNG